ncbi:MAG: hypothetical protein ACJATM_001426 [Alphaproteobacteria bacterium]|jgi:hypothetical protein
MFLYYIMKKDKTPKNETVEEISSNSDYESDESEKSNESVENNMPEPEPEPAVKTKLHRTRSKIVKTDVGEVLVKRGRKAKKQPIVVYLSESEEEEQKVIVKRKKGRPKGSKDKCIVKYIDEDGNEQDSRNKAKRTIIEHTEPDRKMTMKELKLIALEEKLAEMEAITGKKLLATKKGKVDKRTTKQATEKQLAARKKFVLDNAARRLAKKQAKENDAKKLAKDSVKEVVTELVETKKANTKKKAEIMAEIKQESVKVKNVKQSKDDLFN